MYNLYSYTFGSNLNDYPKFSVWPTTTNSAYFATYNLFANGNTFLGADLCAYDRTAMLAGAAASAQVCFQVSDGSVLPSDLDGPTPPNDGEPGYFLDFDSLSTLALRTFAPNFAMPKSSTLSAPTEITVASFQEACGGVTCIPQPGQGRKLDSLGDRLMYRLAYRNFGATEDMVVNHSVVASPGTNVGVRWYLLEAPSGGPFGLKLQGTYSPDTTSYRWMGSIAMDQSGDLALGYSLSSNSIFPSIAVTGRKPTDPSANNIGDMEGEFILQAGGGAQTGTNRWGDYSSMRIDPSDDCTFWYTNQYYPTTATYNWYTYIGAFRFSSCGGGGGGNFSLSVPSPITVAAGAAAATAQVSVMPTGGFTSAVSLSANCAAPITCSFSPNPTNNDTSTLTVSVATNASSGSTTETITGNGAGIINTTTFAVNVPPAQFTLAASPASTTIKAGSNGSVTITAKDAAASGSTKSSVALTLETSQLSSGITATLSSGSINSNGGSTTLKITVPRGVQSGTAFSVTVGGSDGPSGNKQSVTVKGTTR